MKGPIRPIIYVVLFAFLVNVWGPMPLASAGDFVLPKPGVMVHLSPPLDPPMLKGIKVHPNNPFQFEFILDPGEKELNSNQLKEESTKLIKYFLASLTIPEHDLWVNLSPYEKDRVIPSSFGLTEMGRDLLAEDYMLKQITASLIYPEDEVGRKFWKRIYEEAAKRYGTTDIPVNTFNKVWIIPDKAVVYENAKAGTAYVVDSKLKVMLEQDYLSLEKHDGIQSKEVKSTNQLGSQIVREIVIPQLTREINEDKNFSALRQVYNSLILAAWYKRKIKNSILSQVYTDKNKVAGVGYQNSLNVEAIYHRYLTAFKKGVYNYIKEEVDPLTQESIPRKYFSGGVDWTKFDRTDLGDGAMITTHLLPAALDSSHMLMLAVSAEPIKWGRVAAVGIPIIAAVIGLEIYLLNRIDKKEMAEYKDLPRVDFSKGIKGNGKQIRQIQRDINRSFLINKPFQKVDVVHSGDKFIADKIGFNIFGSTLEMSVYEHAWTGLRVIQKTVEAGGMSRAVGGSWEAVKELAQANRPSIVPIFISNKKAGVYYELDLRKFGYKALNTFESEWLTDAKRRKIITAVNEGLRFNHDYWFDHQHLHGGNIFIKTDVNGEIEDVRINDFSLLKKIRVTGNPLLEAIRDHIKDPGAIAKKFDQVDLEWMDLSGFDLHGMIRSIQSCKGSILNQTNFSGVIFNRNYPFSYSDPRGVILRGADLYDMSLSPGLDFEGADLTDAKTGGYYFDVTVGNVKNFFSKAMTSGIAVPGHVQYDEQRALDKLLISKQRMTALMTNLNKELSVLSPSSNWVEVVGVLFGKNNHGAAEDFVELVSLLRMNFSEKDNFNDQRAPLEYGIAEGKVFKIGPNLFVCPSSESFKRHILFRIDNQGEVIWAKEIMIPGDERINIQAKQREKVADELYRKFNETGTMGDYAPGILKLPDLVNYSRELYGKPWLRNQRFEILMYDYDHDGKRLAHITKDMKSQWAARLNMTPHDLEAKIMKGALECFLAVGYGGYFGLSDIHTENFRVSFVYDRHGKPYDIKVQLAGDFASYRKKSTIGILALPLMLVLAYAALHTNNGMWEHHAVQLARNFLVLGGIASAFHAADYLTVLYSPLEYRGLVPGSSLRFFEIVQIFREARNDVAAKLFKRSVWEQVKNMRPSLANPAMLNNGGIDLTHSNLNLQTINGGQEIKFHLNPAQLAQLQKAPGFVPVIINIQPVKDLKVFLSTSV